MPSSRVRRTTCSFRACSWYIALTLSHYFTYSLFYPCHYPSSHSSDSFSSQTYADSEGVPAALTKALVIAKSAKSSDEFNPEVAFSYLRTLLTSILFVTQSQLHSLARHLANILHTVRPFKTLLAFIPSLVSEILKRLCYRW